MNITLVERALRLDAVRRAVAAGHELFEVLYYIRQRAVRVRAGKGQVAVVYRETASVGPLKGRLVTGISGLTVIPPVIEAELQKGVPPSMAGVSIATFMRPVKYLCRHGFNLWDFDVVNAYYSMLLHHILPRYNIAVPPIVEAYVSGRDECIQSLMETLAMKFKRGFSRDEVKQLLCSIGFGGSFYGWCKDLDLVEVEDEDAAEGIAADEAVAMDAVYELEDAIKSILSQLVAAHPQELQQLQGRKNPSGTLLFAIYSNEERRILSAMVAAATKAGGKCVSMEHDGLVLEGDCTTLLEAVQAAVHPLKLLVKPHPQSPWAALSEKFPDYDWGLATPVALKDYIGVTSACREYVNLENRSKDDGGKMAGIVRGNNQTMAKYVAMQLRPVVNVPAAEGEKRAYFEMFCGKGMWHVKHRDDLTAVSLNELGRLMKPAYEMYPKYRDPPRPLGCLCRYEVSQQFPFPALKVFCFKLNEPNQNSICFIEASERRQVCCWPWRSDPGHPG